MANKNSGPNDKDFTEQCVASIGAFQVDLQSWASNSVCLDIDRLKGTWFWVLPAIRNTRFSVSKHVFLRSVSQNLHSPFARFQARRKVLCLFSLIGIVRTNLPMGPVGHVNRAGFSGGSNS